MIQFRDLRVDNLPVYDENGDFGWVIKCEKEYAEKLMLYTIMHESMHLTFVGGVSGMCGYDNAMQAARDAYGYAQRFAAECGGDIVRPETGFLDVVDINGNKICNVALTAERIRERVLERTIQPHCVYDVQCFTNDFEEEEFDDIEL